MISLGEFIKCLYPQQRIMIYIQDESRSEFCRVIHVEIFHALYLTRKVVTVEVLKDSTNAVFNVIKIIVSRETLKEGEED